ncbi:MAG TPA: isoprenylcysteine carboxylmethyltransferase family protein [Candidatus Sulfotelmatobacter sp.]|nr:isoprenylcysteine carboxylmethyltransferase family protein [Candidatus Sulfotelmatobacter sp.]
MDRRKLYIFTVVQIVAIGALLWALIIWNGPWNVQRKVGTALVLLGIIFIAAARFQLGHSFSIRPEAHKLVTTGLYSKIRNPIYVFGMVLVTGVILVFQNPVLWILLPILFIAQTIRARKEAGVLEAAFGDEYREYRKKTWF